MNLSSPGSTMVPVITTSSSPAVLTGMMGQVFVPMLIERAGAHARRRWTEFFAASIANANTSLAYGRAISRFLAWCEGHGLALEQIDTTTVGCLRQNIAWGECHGTAGPGRHPGVLQLDGHRRRAAR